MDVQVSVQTAMIIQLKQLGFHTKIISFSFINQIFHLKMFYSITKLMAVCIFKTQYAFKINKWKRKYRMIKRLTLKFIDKILDNWRFLKQQILFLNKCFCYFAASVYLLV